MWISPNHPDPPPTRPSRPEERGESLAVLPRGADAELRVSLDKFNGYPYVSLRVWERGKDGETFWPVRGKGTTIRVAELAAVIGALCQAERILEGQDRSRGDRDEAEQEYGQQEARPADRRAQQARGGGSHRASDPHAGEADVRARYVDRQARHPARELTETRPAQGSGARHFDEF